MKRRAKILLEKAIDSLVLSIEIFNRPWDRGRHEAVLIFLDRSFELLLKASIVERGGRIRESGSKETIGFDKCVRKCLSDGRLKILFDEQALTLQIINSLRDAAQHYILDISEQQLYMYSQAGVTVFNEILADVFGDGLENYLPERVLPVSTRPPKDFQLMVGTEFDEIKELVRPGKRKLIDARAKLRALSIIEASLAGVRSQPGDSELRRIVKDIQDGKSWQDIFPGVASLHLNTQGSGLSVSIRLEKKAGEAVHLVPEGTPGATVIAVKRVNELDYYSLGLNKLAEKVGLTAPKTLALIKYLELQNSEDYYKIIRVGKSQHKRYSAKVIGVLKDALPEIDMEEVWSEYRAKKK